jgi:hypothetical protein
VLSTARASEAASTGVFTRLHYLYSGEPEAPGGVVAHLEPSTAYLMSVDSTADAARLLGRSLTAPEETLLSGGGMLTWHQPGQDPPPSNIEVQLTRGDGRDLSGRTRIRALQIVATEAGWRYGKEGLMLTRTAEDNHLPVTEGAVLVTNLRPADADELRADVEDAASTRRPSRRTVRRTLWCRRWPLSHPPSC